MLLSEKPSIPQRQRGSIPASIQILRSAVRYIQIVAHSHTLDQTTVIPRYDQKLRPTTPIPQSTFIRYHPCNGARTSRVIPTYHTILSFDRRHQSKQHGQATYGHLGWCCSRRCHDHARPPTNPGLHVLTEQEGQGGCRTGRVCSREGRGHILCASTCTGISTSKSSQRDPSEAYCARQPTRDPDTTVNTEHASKLPESVIDTGAWITAQKLNTKPPSPASYATNVDEAVAVKERRWREERLKVKWSTRPLNTAGLNKGRKKIPDTTTPLHITVKQHRPDSHHYLRRRHYRAKSDSGTVHNFSNMRKNHIV